MTKPNIIVSISNAMKNKLPGVESHFKALPDSRRILESNFNPETARKSAVLLLLYPTKGSWYLPFIQRTIDGTIHSGQIAFPGGKSEAGDADYIETAKRESWEEIGINRNDIKVINVLTPLCIPVSNFVVYPVVGFVDYKPDFTIFKKEVAEIHTVDLKTVLNNDIKIKILQAGNLDIKVPFYLFEGFEVWGATAMILTEFIDVLKSTDLSDCL
jgi:8-oxo-dGTP pyrophosphatase MutT (NUDIX family)